MRELILGLSLLLATASFSQTVPATEDEARDKQQQVDCRPNCGNPPPGSISAPMPPCWPANWSGTGSLIYSGNTDTGSWHYWYCPTGGGKWSGYGVVLRQGALLLHPREPRSSPAATAAAYWKLNAFKPQTPEEKATEAVMLATMAQYLEWAYAPQP
jgi:hypothetical protein